MSEEITTPNTGVSPEGQTPAGNPPTGESGEGTGTTAPITGNPPPKTEAKAPVKTPADFARERILKRDIQKYQSQTPKEDDEDGINQEDADIVKKVVEKTYGDRFNDMDIKSIQEDVESSIHSSEFKEYMTSEDKDQVHKYALDPKYVNLPMSDLIVLALKEKITQISAEIARKATEKMKDTQLPAFGGTSSSQGKDVSQMSNKEYEDYRKNTLGLQ